MENEYTQELIDRCLNSILEAQKLVYKRCLIEGCRFGIKGVDTEPKDHCIYCGEENKESQGICNNIFSFKNE